MDTLRSLLVHFDAGRHATERLAFARGVAAQHEPHLRALFAVAPRFLPMPRPVDGRIAPVPLLDEIDAEHRRHAKARFDRAASGPGWPVEWRELLANTPPVPGFARHALHADLMVLGQHDPEDREAGDVPGDFVEATVLAAGKPALVVPCHGQTRFAGFRTVLVGWQPTREAALALSGALPLLQRAGEVHLVTWDDAPDTLTLQQQDVLDYLRLHGVENVRRHHGAAPANAGAALLSLAQDLGADLLVMGCYGHSRVRELVMGGATRTVLRDMRLPVLMAH
jgi:nucleotide-binding universal stress UspA family protein